MPISHLLLCSNLLRPFESGCGEIERLRIREFYEFREFAKSSLNSLISLLNTLLITLCLYLILRFRFKDALFSVFEQP